MATGRWTERQATHPAGQRELLCRGWPAGAHLSAAGFAALDARVHAIRIPIAPLKKTNQSPIARRMESASSVGWQQVRHLQPFKFAYEFGDEKSTFLSQLFELYKTYAL